MNTRKLKKMEAKENTRKITLVIESESKSNNLWGRFEFNDDLIIDVARTIDELKLKMAEHLIVTQRQ